MTEEENPIIGQENYYEGYQKNIDKLKNKPEYVDFEKLCFLVFSTPDGKHLLDTIEKRYLLPALASPTSANYQVMNIFTEGYKEGLRMLRASVLSHEQRIKAETNPK